MSTNEKNSSQTTAPRSRGLLGVVDQALQGNPVTLNGVLMALGGIRGILESLVCGLIFLIVFMFTRDLTQTLIPLGIACTVIFLVRLIRKETLTPAIIGFAMVGICAIASIVTQEGRGYYLPGLFINAGWVICLSLSLLLRYPLIGIVSGFCLGKISVWRKDSYLYKASFWLTVMWLGAFSLRLVLQVPLYLLHYVDLLGVVRIATGMPFYGVLLFFTWRGIASAVDRSKNREQALLVSEEGI